MRAGARGVKRVRKRKREWGVGKKGSGSGCYNVRLDFCSNIEYEYDEVVYGTYGS